MTATTQPEVTLDATATSNAPYPVTTTMFIDDKPHCFVDQRDYDKLLAAHEASLIRLREIEGKLREPVKYMDQDGDVVSPEYWNSAGDRTKEWFSIPLYSALLLRGKP